MNHQPAFCDPVAHLSRRTLLGAGGGTLLLSALARRLALADELGVTPAGRPKSVILLWLQGGPSQLETFDPHAGTKYGGDVKAIGTSVKGLQIADTLPQVSEWMHLGSVVRSVTGKEGDHECGLQQQDGVSSRPDVGTSIDRRDALLSGRRRT